ncbi:hypothetical protein Dimus_031331 [Dionaea muscipula]
MFHEPLHQSESRQAANDTDVAAKDTDVAAALLLADLAAATSIGTTAATTDDRTGDGQNQDQVNHENMASPVSTSDADRPFRSRQLSRYLKSPYTALRFGKKQDTHIDAWMVYLTKKIMNKGNPEYALVDSYFFIYIENLWKNWDPDSEPDPSQPSKIPEELTNYVWGLNPEWGIKWWNVRHVLAVCLVARSHWVLAHINLEEWTIEIYDSLAHKTPKNPGHRLASFEGAHEDTSFTDLSRGWIFQAKRQKKKNRSFSNTKDSTEKSSQARRRG